VTRPNNTVSARLKPNSKERGSQSDEGFRLWRAFLPVRAATVAGRTLADNGFIRVASVVVPDSTFFAVLCGRDLAVGGLLVFATARSN